MRQPVIEPQGEAKSALWIYKQLGERLGLGDYFQYEDEEDYIREQLKPLGVTLEEVKAKGYAEVTESTHGGEGSELTWNTPSGKIEIFSDTLAKVGFPGVPTWDEPPQPAEGQFYLLTGKIATSTQFGTQNNQLLHKYSEEPRLWMNAQTAAELGLATDDWVEVASEVGQIHITNYYLPIHHSTFPCALPSSTTCTPQPSQPNRHAGGIPSEQAVPLSFSCSSSA